MRGLGRPAERSCSAGIGPPSSEERPESWAVLHASVAPPRRALSLRLRTHLDVPVHLRPATGSHARAPSRGIGRTVGSQVGRHGAHGQVAMPGGTSRRSCMNTGPSLAGTPRERGDTSGPPHGDPEGRPRYCSKPNGPSPEEFHEPSASGFGNTPQTEGCSENSLSSGGGYDLAEPHKLRAEESTTVGITRS